MKRHKHLYDDLTSFANLLQAAQKAQRGKRFLSGPGAFHHNLEKELLRLEEELQTHTYQPGAYHTFTIFDPKPRLISAAPYRDRVVHHALCNIIEPIYERVFIFDSYACRKGKGTHVAVDRLTHFMQSNDYALQCDIRRYFPSLDHTVLKSLLRRKIGCARTLRLLDTLIDASNPQAESADYFPGDDLFSPFERRRGLPIGNQTSQFFANVYLDPLDHFIKETLGFRAYLRYVDDFVLLGDDKRTLSEAREAISDFLETRLRLRLHAQKQSITPVPNGLDFLGYFVFPTHRRLRRSNGVRFARRLRWMAREYQTGGADLNQVRQRIMSWIGHAMHANSTVCGRLCLVRSPSNGLSLSTARGARRFLEQYTPEQLPLRVSEQQPP